MLKFTIPLAPVTKKNSQQIRYRNTWNKKTGIPTRAPYIAPSEAYTRYENAALMFIPRGVRISTPVNIKCLFYMPTRRKCDLTNLLEAIDDIMVNAGLLADDNYTVIESHDGSRVLYDKERPRTVVYIEPSAASGSNVIPVYETR